MLSEREFSEIIWIIENHCFKTRQVGGTYPTKCIIIFFEWMEYFSLEPISIVFDEEFEEYRVFLEGNSGFILKFDPISCRYTYTTGKETISVVDEKEPTFSNLTWMYETVQELTRDDDRL